MVFAPTHNPHDTSDQTITNNGFFPDIEVAAFRATVRASDTVTDGRVVQALRQAMIDTNRELRDWRISQEANGYGTISEVPAEDYGGVSELSHHYLTAVYSAAQAEIIDRYRDTGTTPDGARRAEALEETVDGYLRQARNAIRNILGQPHLTVELI